MDQKQEEKKTANDEDVAFCEEILKTTNYYEILGVEKTATEEEIKKQYKKLALRLHPDKNRAPQATEAFKKVAQALACLTNPNKRKIYDEHGNEENFRTQYREYFQDEDELDPEDLFDLLFTGRINRNRQRRYGRRAYDPQAQAQNMQRGKYYMLMQILPFLLMMVLTVFMQFKGTPDPGFSLTHNEKYSFKRTIDAFDIDYYVEPKFEETFNTPYKKHELEQEVKKAFAENLYRECVLTRRRKMQLEEAKYYASSQEKISSLDEEIEELDWTSCKKFSEIRDSFALDQSINFPCQFTQQCYQQMVLTLNVYWQQKSLHRTFLIWFLEISQILFQVFSVHYFLMNNHKVIRVMHILVGMFSVLSCLCIELVLNTLFCISSASGGTMVLLPTNPRSRFGA
eukprot:TRINITY_DN120321_c0_g1_i1.p1 TRINITY_DN120321_c0_g1~~TRINITY_DN120321_c0_g1_i1.p1  ORF type:complete len:399 (+),score=43.32 TRINITY_DN120321_c0_g1_i1:420-1616(+)